MNDQEKIKLLAEKVMEFEKKYPEDNNNLVFFVTKSYGCSSDYWNPFKSWADCGMLIEKVDGELSIEIWNGHPEWRCRTTSGEDLRLTSSWESHNCYHKSPTRAITEAICKAYGIGDEE